MRPLPYRVVGRAQPQAAGLRTGATARQWPGTYFEARFSGSRAGFQVGDGAVRLRVSIDGKTPIYLTNPVGRYRIAGLGTGRHRVRIDVVSESQAGPTRFGGFFVGKGSEALTPPHRVRQIEFIGDSHTVGYGNTSHSRSCTTEEVWQTTDTAQGIAARVARRFDADYQVNAISGRGVVRNYGGSAGPTLPEAYPYTLFVQAQRAEARDWHPQALVISLGTNDFSTPLAAGEKWSDRAALRRDYEDSYVRFVERLRARNPRAQIILWATDLADGEIAGEARKVVERLNAAGDGRISFVEVAGLNLTGCNFHPDTADDQTIAEAIASKLAGALGTPPQMPPGKNSRPASRNASLSAATQ